MSQQKMLFEKEITKKVHLDYLLYLPQDYETNNDKIKWPLVIFLHGAGERGSDLDLVKKHGIPKLADKGGNLPFIAISPQCPSSMFWGFYHEELMELIKCIESSYSVDSNRIYLTGLSMGGYGTWSLALENPERFAAIVPICGGMDDPEKAKALKNTPTWVFHGAKDSVVPLEESQKPVDVLKNCGGKVQFTIYPDADHDSWTKTYELSELYEWLLQQNLKNRT